LDELLTLLLEEDLYLVATKARLGKVEILNFEIALLSRLAEELLAAVSFGYYGLPWCGP
jgi:hypothetical protein